MSDNSITSWWHQYQHHPSPPQQQHQPPSWNTIDTSIIHHSTFGGETWLSAPITVTLTDIIYSTTQVAETTVTTTPFTEHITSDNNNNNNNNNVPKDNNSDQLPHHLHQLLPVLGLFAVIGLLTILGLMGYMGYRFYRATMNNNNNNNRGQRRRLRNNNDMDWSFSDEGGTKRDDGGENEPMEFENSASEIKAHYGLPQSQPEGGVLDSPIENIEQPISSTFVPITTSPLTLVPRMEVWEDPQRRRGVDELDLWEKKQQRQQQSLQQVQQQQHSEDYSPRSSSETVQLDADGSSATTTTKPASHIEIARKALEKSRLENSSSQWLQSLESQDL
ncbi:hypothetical protein BDA99DRAFT_573020 [Phascolomyces articulosus]|uniref:Transmembrane protein n=1 Tax=Phascolomyces articulosus TaxID=60185 RepID=A0AAD5PEL9_9FUNG|nr:hypothetical protein BDA99DRAFT_573020 [Phascolomyces articulosus]